MVEIAEVPPPSGLGPHALFAWNAALASVGPSWALTEADLLELEAMARAWSRWKQIEEKIAATAGDNVLAGEVSKGSNGRLEVSPLRKAADAAFAAFASIARAYGITMPGADARVPEVDLFGYPDRPGRGQRGRPRFAPTPRDRNRVQLLLALGWSNERIASALEISEPTLRRYFKPQLKERAVMRDRLDARRFEIAMAEANTGNITALKALNAMLERNDLMLARGRMMDSPPPAKASKKGKKEAQAEAAAKAGSGSDWGDDLTFPGLNRPN